MPPIAGERRAPEIAALAMPLSLATDVGAALEARLRAIGEAALAADRILGDRLQDRLMPDDSVATAGKMTSAAPSNATDVQQIGAYLDLASRLLSDQILPLLHTRGVEVVSAAELNATQQTWLHAQFTKQIFPLLVPLAVDPGHPFPHLKGNGINLLVVLGANLNVESTDAVAVDEQVFALVEMPSALNRWLAVSAKGEPASPGAWFSRSGFEQGVYVWAEEVVRACIAPLFPGMLVQAVHLFRVHYAAPIRERDRIPPRSHRVRPQVARLDIEEAMPPQMRLWLSRHLGAPSHTLIRSRAPLAMSDLLDIADRLPRRQGFVRRWLGAAWDVIFGHIG